LEIRLVIEQHRLNALANGLPMIRFLEQRSFCAEQRGVSRRERDVFLTFDRVTSYRLPLDFQFLLLAVEWKKDNLFESLPWRMTAHPVYQRIIGMGWPVVLEAQAMKKRDNAEARGLLLRDHFMSFMAPNAYDSYRESKNRFFRMFS
jgi:hypothetical protein